MNRTKLLLTAAVWLLAATLGGIAASHVVKLLIVWIASGS